MKKFFLPLYILVIVFGVMVFANYSLGNDKDAIAVRVVPNPNHYSIYKWYDSQGFSGSPQALVVDGYEAIRDGRTVYVNAANVIPNIKTIYTNIYLISYNQDSNVKTVDILGQIISHWKFNSNLNDSGNCSISSTICSIDSECQAGQHCNDKGVCELNNIKHCFIDDNCSVGFFCDSVKAKVIRDVNRVGKIEELKEVLAKFKNINGHYPKLSAGTYLSNKTISVWPSWNDEFLSKISAPNTFVDPINRLGYCEGFNPQTCWNKNTKKFIYDPDPSYLKLPDHSYAFVYSTDNDGSNYNICSVMETREQSTSFKLGYQFSPNDPIDNQCVTAIGIISGGSMENTPPRIIAQSLSGEAGQEYNGFIKVIDDQDNPMTWTLITSSQNWAGWNNNKGPILVDTNNPNQKKIYSSQAGSPGTYHVTLIITDSGGEELNVTLDIIIGNQAPFIEAENVSYTLDPKIPLNYSFFYSDSSISGSNLSNQNNNYHARSRTNGSNSSNQNGGYSMSKIEGPFDILRVNGMTVTVSSAGINRFEVNYTGIIPNTFNLLQDTDFVYLITATDKYGKFSTKKFTIHALANVPNLNFSCFNKLRVNNYYLCKIGPIKEGNYNIGYVTNPLPEGLSLITGGINISKNNSNKINKETAHAFLKIKHYIKFLFNKALAQVSPTTTQGNNVFIAGTPTETSNSYEIIVKAINDYGTFNTKSFVMQINDYCGDGEKETPNTENRGGIYNDGYEDCDGEDGTTDIVASSTIDLQYACATKDNTSYPILNNNYCVFASPMEDGGFCGDSYCEVSAGETVVNCPKDCSPDCVVDCDGKECGTDGCSGTCGNCEGDKVCSSGFCVDPCIIDCDGKQCGTDGCSGTCGHCYSSERCNDYGICEPAPHCGDNHCDGPQENCHNCFRDCYCTHGTSCSSNHICEEGHGGRDNNCGNGICDQNENCNSCYSDCPCNAGPATCSSSGICIDCTPNCY